MKKNITLLFCLLALAQTTFAAGVGYIDYSYIYKNNPTAKKITAQMDAKVQEVRNYNLATAKAMKTKPTSEERAKIRTDRQPGLIKLEKEYVILKKQLDDTMRAKVKIASDKVLAEKKLDIIIDNRFRITGGVDCTQEVFKAIK